jgi:hypothetical protein
MNRSPDVELVLRAYFADDSSTAPDHVLDEIEERIRRQPQQRAWRVLRRDSHVNSYLKPLLAVAAVIVIAVAGIAYLGQPSSSGVGGSPSSASSPSPSVSVAPSSSPAVSASPSASAAFPAWFTPSELPTGAGILPAGTSTTRWYKPGTSFTVPEGWVNDLDVSIAYGLFPDSNANEAEFASSGEVANGIFIVSVDSPYFYCEAWEGTSGTAAARAAFLMASEAFTVSEPVDVTIGDLTGKQFDMRVDPDWTATCPGDPPGSRVGDQRNRVTFLDTPGGVIAIAVGSKHAADHEAFLAEAMPIVESFEFDLNP